MTEGEGSLRLMVLTPKGSAKVVRGGGAEHDSIKEAYEIFAFKTLPSPPFELYHYRPAKLVPSICGYRRNETLVSDLKGNLPQRKREDYTE